MLSSELQRARPFAIGRRERGRTRLSLDQQDERCLARSNMAGIFQRQDPGVVLPQSRFESESQLHSTGRVAPDVRAAQQLHQRLARWRPPSQSRPRGDSWGEWGRPYRSDRSPGVDRRIAAIGPSPTHLRATRRARNPGGGGVRGRKASPPPACPCRASPTGVLVCTMARRREVSGIRRTRRLEVQIDEQLRRDLEDVAEDWDVPTSTAAYWLLRGKIAEARGETVIPMGDRFSNRLARWLLRNFPDEALEEATRRGHERDRQLR